MFKDKTDIYQPDTLPENKNPPDSGLGTSQKATTSASGPGVNLTESVLLATKKWEYSYSGYIPGCDKLVPKLEEGELALPNTSQSLELRDYYRCVVPGRSPLILLKNFPYG